MWHPVCVGMETGSEFPLPWHRPYWSRCKVLLPPPPPNLSPSLFLSPPLSPCLLLPHISLPISHSLPISTPTSLPPSFPPSLLSPPSLCHFSSPVMYFATRQLYLPLCVFIRSLSSWILFYQLKSRRICIWNKVKESTNNNYHQCSVTCCTKGLAEQETEDADQCFSPNYKLPLICEILSSNNSACTSFWRALSRICLPHKFYIFCVYQVCILGYMFSTLSITVEVCILGCVLWDRRSLLELHSHCPGQLFLQCCCAGRPQVGRSCQSAIRHGKGPPTKTLSPWEDAVVIFASCQKGFQQLADIQTHVDDCLSMPHKQHSTV